MNIGRGELWAILRLNRYSPLAGAVKMPVDVWNPPPRFKSKWSKITVLWVPLTDRGVTLRESCHERHFPFLLGWEHHRASVRHLGC